jgi:hypothetical protein
LKPTLIIKSAPIQQLDECIPIINEFFQSKLHILTHSHNLELVKKFNDVDKTIVYDHDRPFSILRNHSFKKDQYYNNLVIIVSNNTLKGFLNVLLFALRVPSKKIWSCTLNRQILEVSKVSILSKTIYHLILSLLAIIPTILFSLLLIPLTMGTIFCKKKSE